MSLERRQAILNWASQCGALIMEDDYDSEFRWKGRPVEPLKVLDAEDRVIFVGSFTKTLLPHLRLGYVVLPDSIKEAFIQAKRLYEPMSSACIEQRALALFMKQGHYERHLRRMRRIYSEKYVHLYRGIEQHLSQWIKVHASFCGLHLYAEWRAAEEMYSEFKYECEKAGVCWTDGRHYFYNQPKTALSFGFSQLSSEQMDRGIRIMQQVARSYLKEKR